MRTPILLSTRTISPYATSAPPTYRSMFSPAARDMLTTLPGSRTIEELAAIKPRLRGEAESDVVRLAVAIARRVLRRELTVDPSAIEGLVKAALEQLDTREITRVRVHPDHEAALRRCLEKVVVDRTIELAADGTLERGAVLFETARGNLDASVETQLREIERGLADRFTAT